jgi:phosphate starvation-inducible protein PhoH and related proteins
MAQQASKRKKTTSSASPSSTVVKTFSDSAGETNDYAPARFVMPQHLKSDDIVKPKTEGQKAYWDGLNNSEHVMDFGVGPAGTGKTFMGVAKGIQLLARGDVSRLIMTRPAVEAGEKIGFLPGEAKEKVAPYLIPLFSSVSKITNGKFLQHCLNIEKIVIAPLAFIQGQTFDDAFMILDEAQNCTFEQIYQVTTRAGENSRILLTGDPRQSFLKGSDRNSLNLFMDVMSVDDEGIGIHKLTAADVVRSALTRRIVENVEKYNQQYPNVLPMQNL